MVTAALSVVAVVIGLLSGSALAAPPTRDPGAAIEVLAPYQGQVRCDPTPRPGVTAFRELIFKAYPTTGDSGIVRACSIGGTSEHKEGRAWDWRVSANNPSDVARVRDMTTWLLATDRYGSQVAMARRLGIMYVIWNRQIWKSYQASRGWQPYNGPNPHTDHVHISFGWAGAYKATSYWTGKVAPVMNGPGGPTPNPTASPSAPPRPSPTPSPKPTAPSPTPSPTPSPRESGPSEQRRQWLDEREQVFDSFRGPWRRR